jgi:hypothetical protein
MYLSKMVISTAMVNNQAKIPAAAVAGQISFNLK